MLFVCIILKCSSMLFCEENNNYTVINEIVIDNTTYSDSDEDNDDNNDNNDNESEYIYIEYGYYTP